MKKALSILIIFGLNYAHAAFDGEVVKQAATAAATEAANSLKDLVKNKAGEAIASQAGEETANKLANITSEAKGMFDAAKSTLPTPPDAEGVLDAAKSTLPPPSTTPSEKDEKPENSAKQAMKQ